MTSDSGNQFTAPERLLPIIRRAREFHLYDDAGRRYLDLYQDGGRAILGHRPAGLTTRMKNELSRGLMVQAPSHAEPRFLRRLLRRHPGYAVAALVPTADVPALLTEIAARHGREGAHVFDPAVGGAVLKEPAVEGPAVEGPTEEGPPDAGVDPAAAPRGEPFAAQARPFLPIPEATVLLPVVPAPSGLGVQALLLRAGGTDGDDLFRTLPPPAPFVVRAFEHALGRLEVAERDHAAPTWDPEALGGLWSVRGPYLRFVGPPDRYHEVFRRYLEAGYIVNPGVARASIVPKIYSEGERAGFQRVSEAIAAEVL